MKQKFFQKDGYRVYTNGSGPELGLSNGSKVQIIQKDGFLFKDLAGMGELLPYEDWRLDAKTRAKDLAGRLSIEEIAGLMLYSSHQLVPADNTLFFSGSYGGKSYEDSGVNPWELTDQQRDFLLKDKIRHVLAMKLKDAKTAAKWNNEMQALAENTGFGIPVSISSDPRHGASAATAEFRVGNGQDTSKWPEGIGLCATFDPEICMKFAQIASREYRAMGITTALSPQIDLATDPRWMRFADTFGEHTQLAIDMTRAYCDGMQTSIDPLNADSFQGPEPGWGVYSVSTMAKHWPGGGTGEAGRDAHYAYGKYAVYPGNNFEEHLKPFIQGAFSLNGPTKCTAAIMPYYTISWEANDRCKERVGNSYNHYLISELLREHYGFDGVVCTDWGITHDQAPEIAQRGGACWGVENLSPAQRHYKILMNDVDQFGGNNDAAPLIEAYVMGCREHGEAFMRARMEKSAARLLTNMFRCGLFENPYVDSKESQSIVGCPDFCAAGYLAQVQSVVMVKNTLRKFSHSRNTSVLPMTVKEKEGKRLKVYVPRRFISEYTDFFGRKAGNEWVDPIEASVLRKYFEVAATPEEADFALVYIEAPECECYKEADLKNGGNGYFPISLQYRPYTAYSARPRSIAGGDPHEAFADRGYAGKTNTALNEQDLDNVIHMRKCMGDKPVIVIDALNKPSVVAEFEPYADAILIEFGVQIQAVLDIIAGKYEPSGLLPLQIPKDMENVEKQREDVAFDMEPYKDTCGNIYDFGFGLNWSGVICDERTEKYKRDYTNV